MAGNWLNYHHLLYFWTIAKEGSIVKASDKLRIGASALSSQLKQLEDALNVKLFIRENRALKLTEPGKLALEYADEIFKKGEELLQVFNTRQFIDQSKYRVGALAGLPKSIVCDLLEKAKSFEPNCFVSTYEAKNEELLQALLNFELDVAITNDPGKPISDITRKKIGASRVSIFAGHKYKSLIKNFPNSIKNESFILPTNHSKLRYDIEQLFLAKGITYKLVAECQDSAVKKTLACHNFGLVFLPEAAGMDLVSEKKLIKIGTIGELSEEYWILSAKKLVRNPITEEIFEKLRVK